MSANVSAGRDSNETSSREPYGDVRPIVVAEHASARFGGEAILPLHYFRLLRKRGVETWLVVHERTRHELDVTLREERDRIVYIPDRWVQKVAWHLGRMLPDRVALATFGFVIHSATQLAQQRAVRELVPRVRASIVHEPIPVSPRTPSMMHDVGVPVVIGPMNGGMRYPPGFRHLEGHFERHIVGLARGTAFVANALIPGKRRATALLVANSRTREALPRGTCPRVIELVENGVDLSLFCRALRPTTPRSRVRFVFVGRLIRLKAVDLLLEAIAIASRQADIELHVVGDGPERAALEARCGRLSLADRVLFHGFVAQERCPSLLDDADALVMPSLLDCGGAVVLEAMAMGLPVIATRWGGPADYVDETTGILVAPIAPSALVEGFANAIVKLARSPELRAQMGVAARSRVLERYDWERKIDRILSIYREVQGAAVRGATGR